MEQWIFYFYYAPVVPKYISRYGITVSELEPKLNYGAGSTTPHNSPHPSYALVAAGSSTCKALVHPNKCTEHLKYRVHESLSPWIYYANILTYHGYMSSETFCYCF